MGGLLSNCCAVCCPQWAVGAHLESQMLSHDVNVGLTDTKSCSGSILASQLAQIVAGKFEAAGLPCGQQSDLNKDFGAGQSCWP
jgi:hypothetical protein